MQALQPDQAYTYNVINKFSIHMIVFLQIKYNFNNSNQIAVFELPMTSLFIIIIIIVIIKYAAYQQIYGLMKDVCSIDKLSFPPFSIFSVLLQLPISYSVSQIKELCPSSFYSFHLLSSVLQWRHDEGNLLSEYNQSNWLFY